MFEIGWSELLLIAVVAIIVIGPKELPGVLRGLGRAMNRFRRSADDFRRQFEDSVRDTGFDDIQRDLRSVADMHPANQIRNSINAAMQEPSSRPASPSEFDAARQAPEPPSASPAPPAPPTGEQQPGPDAISAPAPPRV
ncbi:MAG: Sec-independent protein translocase protein TatB [Hyphomicrobiales bacterium]|nr:Sec-independent protein translocase protein TatB [Hyphomicrobiales bacterium]